VIAGKGKDSIDPAVAGNVYGPPNPLAPKVCSTQFRGSEQQIAVSVDRDPEFLFGPRVFEIVAPKPCFDVGERNPGQPRAKRSAERARRVALDHGQLGATATERRGHGPADGCDMDVRILLAGAIEPDAVMGAEAEVVRVKRRMLAGEDKARRQSAPREGRGDWGKLDCFRTCADN
jgi:hypothetical protein